MEHALKTLNSGEDWKASPGFSIVLTFWFALRGSILGMLKVVDGWYLWFPVMFLVGAHNVLPILQGPLGDNLYQMELGYVLPVFVALGFRLLDECLLLRNATDW
jgi:hypothetical protein